MRRILVLKGGGVRGVIQLESLDFLERYYKKPICEIFDLIVGTSVGSITGGILATGKYSAAKFYDLFIKYLPLIFKKERRILSLKPLYSRDNFYQMWTDLYPFLPEIRMKDCKTKFMCTSVNLCDFKTHFFKSWQEKDGEISLREALARSFAAPYYFGALVDEESKSVWFDGGSGESNTPLHIAYTEGINLGWYREKVEIIVLGTGTIDESMPFEKAKDIGTIRQMLAYMNPLRGGLARVQSTLNQVDQMRIIARSEPLVDFYYYDIDIGPEYDGMDRLELIQEYQAFGSLVADKLRDDKDQKDNIMPRY